MPKISVIMGVYNNEKTLKRAVDSLLNQTQKDFELIICDDGSKDKSWEVMQAFAMQDSRIRILKNEKNIGHPGTLNRCLGISTGIYIARMDADDESLPERFAIQAEYLDKTPSVALVGTQVILAEEDMTPWGIVKSKHNPTKFDWAWGTCVFHPSVMIRKSALLKCGAYKEDAYFLEDYELWMRMIARGEKIENICMPLIKYQKQKKDFNKQKFKYRIAEIALRFKGYRAMKVPWWYYFLIFKPILMFLIPKSLLYSVQKIVSSPKTIQTLF